MATAAYLLRNFLHQRFHDRLRFDLILGNFLTLFEIIPNVPRPL